MDKDFYKTLSQVPMFSKMGKYISNKILKYNKSKKRKHIFHSSQKQLKSKPQNVIHNQLQQNPINNSSKQQDPRNSNYHQTAITNQLNNSSSQSLNKTQNSFFQSLKLNKTSLDASPPVGYYKLNYNQVQKNPKVYNFKRSVPHFHRQNHHSNQHTYFYKTIPDSLLNRQTGLTQLKRIVGRQDIKGSIRAQPENPHESRFILNQNSKSSDFNKSLPNFNRMLGRQQIIHNGQTKSFRNKKMTSPDYECNFQISKKRLNTHVFKFEKYSNRTDKYFYAQTGISNCFNSDETEVMYNDRTNFEKKASKWQNQIGRQRSGIVPSYLDKNVNSRSALKQINLRSLQMNCTDLRLSQGCSNKLQKIKKNKMKEIFDKQNNKTSRFQMDKMILQ